MVITKRCSCSEVVAGPHDGKSHAEPCQQGAERCEAKLSSETSLFLWSVDQISATMYQQGGLNLHQEGGEEEEGGEEQASSKPHEILGVHWREVLGFVEQGFESIESRLLIVHFYKLICNITMKYRS